MLKSLSGIIEQWRRGRDVRSIASGRSPRQPLFSRLRAKYDAANTTLDNVKHWSRADGLSASAANSPDVRRILRNRSRYEVANNSYARGITLTLANDVVGTGPRLQMLTTSPVSQRWVKCRLSRSVPMTAYETTPIAAFDLCSVGTVSDFKEVARYRLLGTGGFEKVAPDGELKHGKLSDQKYSNKADTYGQILTLTRHDIINDDLSAFMDIPRQMGRSGAESIDELFFTLLLKNTGFFSSANGNLLSGPDTKFGPESLTVAKTTFRKQKAGPGNRAKDQKPINIRPEFLVVPVELETDAELLMGSAQLMIDAQGTPTKIPVDNPHRNKYRVISTPHLSDTYYQGASGSAWYLFANPNVLPAFEIVFLNGRRTPVIERVEMPPNTLGMGFRSYIDFGVNSQDSRAAVKVTGE